MSNPEVVSVDVSGSIGTVTLNRPESRNALNRQVLDRLQEALAALAQRSDLRCLILTGAGDAAFCSGADLRERLALNPEQRTEHTRGIATVANALEQFPVPVIAAIRGYALAGGAELAVACDLRVAGDDAVIGLPEVRVGLFPGAGGVVRLPRLVGAGRARDLLYTGRRVQAAEALAMGLVDRVCAAEALHDEARSLAYEIAHGAPLAIRALKRALLDSWDLPAQTAHEAVWRHRITLDVTRDYEEGLNAFAERRAPRFTGE